MANNKQNKEESKALNDVKSIISGIVTLIIIINLVDIVFNYIKNNFGVSPLIAISISVILVPSIIFIIYVIVVNYIPKYRIKFFEIIKFYLNPQMILDLLTEIKNNQKNIADSLEMLASISTIAKLFSLTSMNNVIVVHTHRRKYFKNPCDTYINKDTFVQSSIANDEATLIYNLMHWIFSIPAIKTGVYKILKK